LPLFIGAIKHRLNAKKAAAEAGKLPPAKSPSNGENGTTKGSPTGGKSASGETNNVHHSAGE
jgi:hypothetical protein